MLRFAVLLLSLFPHLCFAQVRPPSDGLAGYWPFNGTVEDESPNDLPSIPHHVSWADDRFGRPNSALNLNGDHTYVEVPDHPALHLYNFTYSLWLRAEEWVQNDAFFLAKRLDKPANRFSIALYPRGQMLNTFICDSVGNENYFHSLSLWALQPGTWHHVAVVGDYATMSYLMYIDGELAGHKDLNIAAAYDSNPLTFGVWALHGDFGDFYKGQLDDIRIYNRALPPETINQLAADRPGGKAIGTVWMNKDLPDGRYVAHQIERNGIISNVPFLFELKRRRPLWQNGLFLGGSLLLACGLALLAQYQRNRQKLRARRMELDRLQAIEQERSRIARDLHDDLGSGLSAISLLTEIARQKSTDAGLDVEIQQISETSGELSHKIREIIWLVSARFDNLENLVSYLHHFTTELFAASTTELEVNLPENIPAGALDGEQRRAFFQAVKTALLLLRRRAPASLCLSFYENNPFTVTLRFPDPELITGECGASQPLGQALQKLNDIGGAFSMETAGLATLRFSLKPQPA